MLDLMNRNKSFGTDRDLNGIDFRSLWNHFYTLKIHNGSDKVILANLISNFLKLEEGLCYD